MRKVPSTDKFVHNSVTTILALKTYIRPAKRDVIYNVFKACLGTCSWPLESIALMVVVIVGKNHGVGFREAYMVMRWTAVNSHPTSNEPADVGVTLVTSV